MKTQGLKSIKWEVVGRWWYCAFPQISEAINQVEIAQVQGTQ